MNTELSIMPINEEENIVNFLDISENFTPLCNFEVILLMVVLIFCLNL